MQVLLHADPNTDGSHPMSEHLEAVAKDALGRFGERITRVEVHLSDVNSLAKTGPQTIHCQLEARLVGLDTIVVNEHADTAHQAIDGGMRKLKRAVGASISKHDPRNRRPSAAEPAEPTEPAEPGPQA